MKHLLPLLLITLSFASCSSYRYLTLDSSQLTKNDRKAFSWENDTLKITYSFAGDGGPVHIGIINKTQQPLYVNWKKSAMILDKQSVSLYNNTIQASGSFSANSSPTAAKGYRMADGGFNATFIIPEGMDFIPPGAGIEKDLLSIVQSWNLLAPIPDSVQSIKIADENGIEIGKIKKLNFTEPNSPIRFRSYLTFMLGQNPGYEFSESHSFYVQEMVETGIDPVNFIEYASQGDQLYIKR